MKIKRDVNSVRIMIRKAMTAYSTCNEPDPKLSNMLHALSDYDSEEEVILEREDMDLLANCGQPRIGTVIIVDSLWPDKKAPMPSICKAVITEIKDGKFCAASIEVDTVGCAGTWTRPPKYTLGNEPLADVRWVWNGHWSFEKGFSQIS